MHHRGLEVPIEPSVLTWARESAGYDAEEVARRLRVSKDKISRWESGEEKLTLSKLERLATKYKRPLAVFFLPTPPEEKPFPKDFRTFRKGERVPFSPETRLAIRRAWRLQSLAEELIKSFNREPISQIGMASLSDDPEILAIKIRRQLGVDIQIQFGWRNENEALNEWKKAIERHGVFVFQLAMPLQETRGFSLTEGKPPIIILNRRDATNGRIFSLFHEYAHLLLNDGGICDMEDLHHRSGDGSIERFCNHVAGATLVPENDLLNHKLVKGKEYLNGWPDEILRKLSGDFKVSREVVLRRLVMLKRASSHFYSRKHKEWKEELEATRRRKRGGRRIIPQECIWENGVPFVSLVLDARRQGKITYSDVLDYLGIRLKHLPKIEQLLRRQSFT